MADIFISYASADRDTAKLLAESLSQRGYSVWWDRTIPPGRVFDEVIQEALDAAACVIVLWSKTSIASNWVKAESSDALTRGRLVPALIDKVAPPIEFRRIQAADLTQWHGAADHAEYVNLLAAVQQLLAHQPATNVAATIRPASLLSATKRLPMVSNVVLGALAIVVVLLIARAKGFMHLDRDTSVERPLQDNALTSTSSTATANNSSIATTNITNGSAISDVTIVQPGNSDRGHRTNLLSPDNGGQLLVAATDKWSALIDGKEDGYVWIDSGIGVFGFADGKAATFDTFAVLIPSTYDYNLKEFELYAGNEGPTGHFDLIGKFTTQNVRMMQQPYQEFHFPPVTAKYLKFHTLSNQAGSTSAVLAYEFRLFGTIR